jgi:hypothetical protein
MFRMRKLLPVAIAAGTLLPAIGVASAGAITPGTAARFKAAAMEAGAVEPVVYICKQRYWSGKRYCYWRPSGYHWGWRWRWPRWWR